MPDGDRPQLILDPIGLHPGKSVLTGKDRKIVSIVPVEAPVSQALYLFSQEFLTEADRLGFPVPLDLVESEDGTGWEGQVRMSYCLCSPGKILNFTSNFQASVATYIRAGFQMSAEEGRMRANSIMESRINEGDFIGLRIHSCLGAATLEDRSVVSEHRQVQLEELGWFHSEIK